MDQKQFDALTRFFGSRRNALKTVIVGALGATGLLAAEGLTEVEAGNKSRRSSKKKGGKKGKSCLCHFPPGNPDNAHVICVGNSAVNTHLNKHGDCLCTDDGCCPNGTKPGTKCGGNNPPPPVCREIKCREDQDCSKGGTDCRCDTQSGYCTTDQPPTVCEGKCSDYKPCPSLAGCECVGRADASNPYSEGHCETKRPPVCSEIPCSKDSDCSEGGTDCTCNEKSGYCKTVPECSSDCTCGCDDYGACNPVVTCSDECKCGCDPCTGACTQCTCSAETCDPTKYYGECGDYCDCVAQDSYYPTQGTCVLKTY